MEALHPRTFHDRRGSAAPHQQCSAVVVRRMGVSDYETRRLVEEVYDLIKDIRDPEKPHTLEELGVVSEEEIRVERDSYTYLSVTLMPTVPHCHLAAIIGLCVRQKLERELPYSFKVSTQHFPLGVHATASCIQITVGLV